MDGELLTWIFLVGGIILMLLELALPGGLAFFLGLSGLGVGMLRWFGIVSEPGLSVMIWLLMSVTLTIAIRPFIKRFFKGETTYKIADEDYEAIGQIVDVLESVSSGNDSGRIRFHGISWQAKTMEGTIPAGVKAKIVYRENTTWVIESADEMNSQINREPVRNN